MNLRNSNLAQAQLDFELHQPPVFPATRYQGSKAKIVGWIVDRLSHLEYETCLDAFGGTGVVSHALKMNGAQVTYNDLLPANLEVGRALIENPSTRMGDPEVDALLDSVDLARGGGFIERTFHDIYFTDEENRWLDQVATGIPGLKSQYSRAIAYFALFQACIAKRPYNLFHRKNLYMRLADVDRTFGNKATWDTPFPVLFRRYVSEANAAVFDNGRENRAVCGDALHVPGEFDLVYVDTPYIASSGTTVDYAEFYHFLNGLVLYEHWPELVDYDSKHRRMKRVASIWNDKTGIAKAFDELFDRFAASSIAVSYRSDGIPDVQDIVEALSRHKSRVAVETYGQYKYVLSKNGRSHEVLIVGQ